MNQRQMLCLATVILAAAVTLSGTDAFAAAAAKKGGGSARDKAISECVAKAKATQNPFAPVAADPSDAGMAVYKSCMREKGMRP
jgi:CDP-diacylglycerol pyrophosphatase